jgi:phosphate transport system substrate-binding protein
MMSLSAMIASAVAILASLASYGCLRKSSPAGGGAEKVSIQNSGSDTMVNVAQAWAEEYARIEPSISVEVSGGGSGTGIAALINGTVDIVNSSRKMEPGERLKARERRGKDAKEFIAGYDALAIYVHRENPLSEIAIEQIGDIYREHGRLERWSQLGVSNAGCKSDRIILISRQSNSGTYHYFREAVVGKKQDFKLGSLDLHGSKDVVELIGRTPCAIGYSGMGYATHEVKMLRVARRKGEPAFPPTPETTLSGQYPIARPLYLYTAGEPTPHVRKYLDWILSPAGQKIVAESGYVGLPETTQEKQR